MRTQPEIDAIVNDVQSKLRASKGSTGLDLEVPAGGYVQEDDWLSIIVAPTSAGIRAHEYVAALSDVERQLRADGINHVLLVPAIAD